MVLEKVDDGFKKGRRWSRRRLTNGLRKVEDDLGEG